MWSACMTKITDIDLYCSASEIFDDEVFIFRDERKSFFVIEEVFAYLVEVDQTTGYSICQDLMQKISTAALIHGFALLHAVVTILCLVLGIGDSLPLTLLSMTLTVLICIRAEFSVEFTAISVILVNIGGFILGTLGADLIGSIVHNALAVRSAATFVTTEVMGWSMHLFARSFHPAGSADDDRRRSWHESIGWLVFAVLAVFFLRLAVNIIFQTSLYEDMEIFSILSDFLRNSLLLILLISITALFICTPPAKGIKNRFAASAATVLFILAISAAAAAFHCSGLPFRFDIPISRKAFSQVILISGLVEVTLYAVIYMIRFAADMHTEVIKEREKTHQAEFRYMTLKQQMNPHFLFNSLNILDSLITEGKQEDASRYTHKLANVYRYMLRHEGEKLVQLSEEIRFADMYKELLLVRFPSGLVIEAGIRDEDMSRYVVPCSLQLLIENAIKHNAISADRPLVIRISSDGKTLSVYNNVNPKVSEPQSTGLGLKYIRQQYADLSGTAPDVRSLPGEYSIRLPLL